MTSDFVHLHVHTEYSLLDGACRIGRLFEHVKACGQSAVAITDHGVMYGVVDFYEAAMHAGVKPIIGCEVYVAPRTRTDRIHELDSDPHHLVLLCENQTGYQNLCEMVSAAFTEGFYVKPRVDRALLQKYHEGLIALSACLSGELAKLILAGQMDNARQAAIFYRDTFGENNFFLELQDHGLPGQHEVNRGLQMLSQELGIEMVVTNDAHYIRREDAAMQDVLLCIQTNKTVDDENRMGFEGDEFYLKSEAELRQRFPHVPQAFANTADIARRCNVSFSFGEHHLPRFALPEGETDTFAFLQRLTEDGFYRRFPQKPAGYQARIDHELAMIRRMGFVDYFLIVSDFIAFAKEQGIAVGPGRGSAAGSMVSYCLGITDVDPIRYGLYFERFLNPERISMPDIDIDFCVQRRGEVIQYVTQKYGADKVAQIITFGTMAARGSIRDVGRALNYPYAEVDVVAKLVPWAVHMTLDDALKTAPRLKELYDDDERVRRLIDTAKDVEGTPRHASTHAAGVVITESPMRAMIPLCKNDEAVVTQFPMGTLEKLGFLKMDFLGLRNLTVIQDTERAIRQNDPAFSIGDIPEDDEKTFAMLSSGKTSGVFQLESAGMTGVCVGLRPQSIEDITAVVALFRPGPMDSIPRFIESKHNLAKVTYKHPQLEDILKVTYGCIVYQEQVLEIFRKIGGFSLGNADMVRRAMSKKKMDELQRHQAAFLEGAQKNGVDRAAAQSIFDEIRDFAHYAFNKAHAVCYAVIAYRTAYLKCHFPRDYMAALMTSVLDYTPKLSEYIAECKDMGIRVLPPDVNRSRDVFTVTEEGIRFGLVAVKGIGQAFIDSLLREREKNGAFTSFTDFCERVFDGEGNRKALENLIKCGALDSLAEKRSAMLSAYGGILDAMSNNRRRNLEGQIGLFAARTRQSEKLPDMPELPLALMLEGEKETCGFYLSGHPMESFSAKIKKLRAVSLQSILSDFAGEGGPTRFHDEERVTVCGLLTQIRTKTTRNNSLMAYVTLEDETAAIELLLFSGALNRSGPFLKEGTPLVVKGKISAREEKEPQILADEVFPLSDYTFSDTSPRDRLTGEAETAPLPRKLYIRVPKDKADVESRILPSLSFFPGNVPVIVVFETSGKKMGGECAPDPRLVDRLCELLGENNIVAKWD